MQLNPTATNLWPRARRHEVMWAAEECAASRSCPENPHVLPRKGSHLVSQTNVRCTSIIGLYPSFPSIADRTAGDTIFLVGGCFNCLPLLFVRSLPLWPAGILQPETVKILILNQMNVVDNTQSCPFCLLLPLSCFFFLIQAHSRPLFRDQCVWLPGNDLGRR